MDRSFYEKEITVRLFICSNALQTYLDRLLKEDNLTAKQFLLMIILGSFDSDPMISELATRFGTSHQNVKQVVLKLERSGYVEIYIDPLDSRKKLVRFTKNALDFWDRRSNQDEKQMSELYSMLSIEDLSVFRNSLMTMIATIDQMSNTGGIR